MFERYKIHVDRLVDGVINTSGDTNPALRQNLLARGKKQAGASGRVDETLPPELTDFVDKVTFSPYDVRDDDITALHDAGYSDDAIVEIIGTASLAAGLGRLEIVSGVMQREEGKL